MKRATEGLSTAEKVGFVVLGIFTAASVFGYWNFVLNPERLPPSPVALRFFSVSFQFFGQLHIVVAAAALGVLLIRRLGWRWWPAPLAVCALSFLSEHVGTGFGFPFGGYAYTGLLGAKLGGRVPALIPVSWFLMALPCWVVAHASTARAGSRAARLALGAAWLTAWDLALDPAMSHLTAYWVWEDAGPYYGMPWINLFGWYATGLALMLAIDVLASRTGLASLPARPLLAYYLLVLALPLGMLLAAGRWLAVTVTLVAVAALGSFSWRLAAARVRTGASRYSTPSPAGAR
jgi:putative membrane protein